MSLSQDPHPTPRRRPAFPAWRALALPAWLLLGALLSPASPAAPPAFHPPLGPHTGLTDADFAAACSSTAGDRLVLTPYFYWYDVYSGAHLFNADGSDALTDHPPTTTGFSYRSAAWHREQLRDMEDAGIDVVLPVYWGEPSQRRPGQPIDAQPWSFSGIPPLVDARETLLAQGRKPPRIGLFYDTSTLQFNEARERIDLTTDRGRQWFYESIRDFFSLVPPAHWAMIDGHPIVFLYSSSFAAAYDGSCLETLRAAFARDFGGRTPYVVREISWNVASDQVYAWGGALGLKNPGVASLGPGYDHSAVPGRDPLIVPREEGRFFERNWLAFLRRPSPMVFIETWNEFHEGTDIAHSRQYGRQYLDLNRRFVDLFKAGYVPPRPVGPYTDARIVDIQLGATNQPRGLVQFDWADGVTTAAERAGAPCRVLAPTSHAARYLYLRIDESFKWNDPMEVLVVVEFFDADRGTLRVEFDGSDLAAPFQGAYSPSPSVAMSGSGSWRTATFRLSGAHFTGAQNGGADLRLSVGNAETAFRHIQVLREGLKTLRHDARDGCELRLYAAPGMAYDIEASDNLQAWQPLVRLLPSTAVSRHLDSTARGLPHRWYRLRRPAS